MKIKPELYHVTLDGTTAWGCDTPEKLAKEQAKFNGLDFIRMKDVEFKEGESYYNLVENDKYVLSKDQIIELSLAGIKFEIKQVVDVEVDITQQILDLAEKPVRIAMESGAGGNTYNNKCEVHMPGNILAMYNEVCLLEDCCTDELQTALNAGWRMVAACPQPDQRRPDYILGRFNPHNEGDYSSARRQVEA